MMPQIKDEILYRHCYTELVYDHINKKLHLNLSHSEIEKLVVQVLRDVQGDMITKIGKNYYVTDEAKGIRLTINSQTFRVITADRI